MQSRIIEVKRENLFKELATNIGDLAIFLIARFE